jgi:predicted nuclease with TOPRIM domain
MKTIAEIAEEIGVSRQAIHLKIKQEPLSSDLQNFTSSNGKVIMIDEEGESLIKSSFPKNKLSSTSQKILDIQEKLIDTLQNENEHLRQQNQQFQDELRAEREHSRDIAERLAKLNENQQVLLLSEQTKNKPLLSEITDTEVKENKQSLWQKLFKNKKN